jgi:carboxypeptidase D
VFPFNSTFWTYLQNVSDTCGYTNYSAQHVKYPPAGQLPFPSAANQTTGRVPYSCDIWDMIAEEAYTCVFLRPAKYDELMLAAG